MTERLMAKLDRLGAEAGIKEMTPEIYRFSQLLNDDKLQRWDEWRSQRTWVDLTDEQIEKCYETTGHYQTLRPQDRLAVFALAKAIQAKLKEKNT